MRPANTARKAPAPHIVQLMGLSTNTYTHIANVHVLTTKENQCLLQPCYDWPD